MRRWIYHLNWELYRLESLWLHLILLKHFSIPGGKKNRCGTFISVALFFIFVFSCRHVDTIAGLKRMCVVLCLIPEQTCWSAAPECVTSWFYKLLQMNPYFKWNYSEVEFEKKSVFFVTQSNQDNITQPWITDSLKPRVWCQKALHSQQ